MLFLFYSVLIIKDLAPRITICNDTATPLNLISLDVEKKMQMTEITFISDSVFCGCN
jgi:hypothetical protein